MVKRLVVINQHAGAAGEHASELSVLKDQGYKIIEAKNGKAAHKIAKEYLQKHQVETLVVAGGDGTVSGLANLVVQISPRTILGIVPLGTGNDLARTLGIPLETDKAIELIIHGRAAPMDAIQLASKAREDMMFNVATGGNSTKVTEATSSEAKQRFKAWSYALNIWHGIRDQTTFHITAEVDGVLVQSKALNVIIANGRTVGGGFEVAPKAKVDDGYINLIVVRTIGIRDMMRLAAKLAVGGLKNDHRLLEYRCRTLKLSTSPPMALSIDGDVCAETPIEFSIVDRAIRVITPSTT